MKLIKTSFFSSIVTLIRIVSGFASSKIVAIFTGASGIAIIGMFTNFITIVLNFANGAINTGVIKYTAEMDGDERQLESLFSTSLKITICSSVLIGCLLFSFAHVLSLEIFNSDSYYVLIRVFAATLLFYSLNTLLISILNGKKEIRSYTIVNVIGSIVGLLVTLILVYYYKLSGAMYALVLSQSIVLFVTIALIIKSTWFKWRYFSQPFSKKIAIKLSHYSLMTIVSAITVPIGQIILRNIVISKINLESAGYWQGMMRVSDGYLLLITTSLSVYYLPQLSSLKTNQDLKKEVWNGYKILLPIVALGCAVIYFLRFFIIDILYTHEFRFMENLFIWQLTGDFFKIATWILAYLMLAKSMTKLFILTEIVFNISYVLLGYFLINYYKLQGVTIAFAINYFLSFIFMLIVFRSLMFKNNV